MQHMQHMKRVMVRPALAVQIKAHDPTNNCFRTVSLEQAAVVLGGTEMDGCDTKAGPPTVTCEEGTVANFTPLTHEVNITAGDGMQTALGAYRLTLLLAGCDPTQTERQQTKCNMGVYFSADVPMLDVLGALRTGSTVLRYVSECTDGPDPAGVAQHVL